MPEIEKFAIFHPALSIGWIGLLIAVLFTTFKDLTSKVKIASHSEVIQLINNNKAIVVDLRQHEDFRNGHIIGSINLLPIKIKSDNIGELNKYKDNPIIVVDSIGVHSKNLAILLNTKGFKKVFVLKDGILGWNRENLPLVRGK